MIERLKKVNQFAVVEAAFDAYCALADGGQRDFRRQRLTNARLQLQTLQSGGRQNNSVILAGVEFRQARSDVAAQRADHQIRAAFANLALTAQAGRADYRALRQRVERVVVV